MRKEHIGLDIGTDSCGIAVTDEGYNLINCDGHPMYGSTLYPEGKTCKERRDARNARRNKEHKNNTLDIVKGLFRNALLAEDPDFFKKTQNSYLHPDDRAVENIAPYTYHLKEEDKKEIPTIAHLQSKLIHNPNDYPDIRYTWAATYALFKRRGHFLNNGLDPDNAGTCDVAGIFGCIHDVLEDVFDENIPEIQDPDKVMEILTDSGLSKKDKKNKLAFCLGIDKGSKKANVFLKLICGSKIKIKELAETDDSDESICFSDSEYSDKTDMYARAFGHDIYKAVEQAKILHDTAILAIILQEEDYLCDARIKSYDKHKEDLGRLKKVTKKYGSKKDKEKGIMSDYDKIFRSSDGAYSIYVNKCKSNGVTIRRGMGGSKKRSKETFYDTIKTLISQWNAGNDPDIIKILNDIEMGTFMPKQITSQNCVIPNQVHYKMLRDILANAGKYHPFLLEKDERGLTVIDKILMLFTFRIPYFVGPLSEKSEKMGGNGWVVRNEPGEVTPWNFSEKVNEEETRKRFIERMIKHCTYLPDKKAMPKESLAYQEFTVLNGINNIKINSEPFPASLKQDIIDDLYKRGKKVTKKGLFSYLAKKGVVKDISEISGIKDDGIGCTLSSYAQMYKIFGDRLSEADVYKAAEDIIYYSTIFGSDKQLFEKYIRKTYGEGTSLCLDNSTVEALSKLRFSDWGTLSDDFIHLKGVRLDTNEKITLIDALKESCYNFMQLINSNDRYDFKSELESRTEKKTGMDIMSITLDDLDLAYASNPVKRMIWQAILSVRGVIKKTGRMPDRLFIESTRFDGEKVETLPRGKFLKDKYEDIIKNKDCPAEDKNVAAQMLEYLKGDTKTNRLKDNKLFLWYCQMGRDAYTGKPIDYEAVKEKGSKTYDKDHIIPQRDRKETSVIDGLVLTEHDFNCNVKKDRYPIDASIRNNPAIRGLWDKLLKYKLMSEEKHKRLVRSTPLTTMEKLDFINSQIVAVGQTVILVKNTFTDLLPDTEIVLVKPRVISEFRQEFDIPKARILNSDHHAHDAYLAIVAGNVHHVKFTKNPYNYIKAAEKGEDDAYNLSRVYKCDVIRNGEIAWKAGSGGSIDTVYKSIYGTTPEIRNIAYENHGQFTDINPKSHREATDKTRGLSLKQSGYRSDIFKYGYYGSVKGAYFFIAEYDDKKGGRKTSYEQVPIYLKNKIESDPDGLEKYCTESLGMKNVVIKNRKILPGTKISIDGYHIFLTGKSGKRIVGTNAEPLRLPREDVRYVTKIEKYVKSNNLDALVSADRNIEFYDKLTKTLSESIFAKRVGAKKPSFCDILKNGRDKFMNLPVQDEKNDKGKIIQRGQLYVLYQILSATSIGGNKADLVAIGGVENSGTIYSGCLRAL